MHIDGKSLNDLKALAYSDKADAKLLDGIISELDEYARDHEVPGGFDQVLKLMVLKRSKMVDEEFRFPVTEQQPQPELEQEEKIPLAGYYMDVPEPEYNPEDHMIPDWVDNMEYF